MATEIIMPKVDMVMETGTLMEWLKQEGDEVKKGEPIFVIETDKAAIEVESPDDGILAGISAKAGDVVPVTDIVAYVIKPGESVPEAAAPAAKAEAQPAQDKAEKAESGSEEDKPAPEKSAKAEDKDSGELLRATPLARTIAREKGIDLANVDGSGPRGRIYKADVFDYLEKAPASTSSVGAFAVPDLKLPLPDAEVLKRVPLRGPRALIAERMSYSSMSIPHINETVSIDMSEVIRLREKVMFTILEKTDLKVSYTAIVAYIVAKVLMKHPAMNSSLVGEEIVFWQDVHLGIATSIEDYLIVPVVRNASEMTLADLVVEMDRLVTAARSKKLTPSEMSGSTFTISNLGMYGIESFTAIINPPESTILAVGKMQKVPVVVGDELASKPMMTITAATDHRINDGASLAKFLIDLKETLENPYNLFVF